MTILQAPPESLQKLTGKAGFDHHSFRGILYNGSDWRISSVTIRVAAIESNGTIRWMKDHKTAVFASPLTTSTFSVDTLEVAPQSD